MFVDVRDPEAWDAGRVTGALSMAAAEFPQSYFALVPQPDPAIPLVVYGAGADSFAVRRVAAELGEMGHGDVAFLTGGFAALEAAGLPAESAAGSTQTSDLSTEAAEVIP